MNEIILKDGTVTYKNSKGGVVTEEMPKAPNGWKMTRTTVIDGVVYGVFEYCNHNDMFILVPSNVDQSMKNGSWLKIDTFEYLKNKINNI
jgi:hypothetical protein